MSLYQLHRAVYDTMRAGEVSSGKAPVFDIGNYDLTDEERKSIESRDIAALYRMGLHPVLLNGFCRASGYSRDEYRSILAPYATAPGGRKGRWQK